MRGCTADAALEGFTRQMKRLPAALRKSMTYDRGTDPLMVCEQTTAGLWMACHPELARRLKIDIWFCDPHAPWQRGSNENTNGLLRQFFLKGTDLSDVSQTELELSRFCSGQVLMLSGLSFEGHGAFPAQC